MRGVLAGKIDASKHGFQAENKTTKLSHCFRGQKGGNGIVCFVRLGKMTFGIIHNSSLLWATNITSGGRQPFILHTIMPLDMLGVRYLKCLYKLCNLRVGCSVNNESISPFLKKSSDKQFLEYFINTNLRTLHQTLYTRAQAKVKKKQKKAQSDNFLILVLYVTD